MTTTLPVAPRLPLIFLLIIECKLHVNTTALVSLCVGNRHSNFFGPTAFCRYDVPQILQTTFPLVSDMNFHASAVNQDVIEKVY